MKSRYYKTNLVKFHYLDNCLNSQETIIFLHGFTGSSKDFSTIPDYLIKNYRCLVPDLPGHGKTQIEDETIFTASGQVSTLEKWLKSLERNRFHLYGYSMGGRLALQFAVKNPRWLQSLILVSTTAGINEESERLLRAKADEQIAQQILDLEPVNFLYTWLAQPLFREITNKGEDFVTKEVQRRLPIQTLGLASNLKYFSSGVMPPVWQQLVSIEIPTLVLAGSKDQKYLTLASQLTTLIPKAILKVLPTGHSPLVESPDLLWKDVVEFFTALEVQAP